MTTASPPGRGATSEGSLRFLLPQSLDAARSAVKAELLSAALSKALGRLTTVDIAPTYDAIEAQVRADEVDVAWAPPDVCARLRGDVRAILTAVRHGLATYRAAIVCLDDSDWAQDRLAGARAAWVDRRSSSGYLLPSRHLRDAGIAIDEVLVEQTFAGSNHGALRAVLEGRADLASVHTATADPADVIVALSRIVGADAERFRVLAVTDVTSNDALVVSRRLRRNDARSLIRQLQAGDRAVAALLDICDAEAFVLSSAEEAVAPEASPSVSTPAAPSTIALVVRAGMGLSDASTYGAGAGAIVGALSPAQRQIAERVVEAAARSGSTCERLLPPPPGAGTRWHATALPGGEGTVTLVLRDVTLEETHQPRLVELASYPLLFPSPVVELSAEGSIVFANPAARRVFGDEARGDVAAALVHALDGITEHDGAEAFHCVVQLKDSEFALMAHLTETGTRRIVLRDRTAESVLRREKVALQRRVHEAEKMALVGTVAAGVAHELNNPLTYVLANTELAHEHLGGVLEPGAGALAREPLEEVATMLEEAVHGVRQLGKVVSDMRAYSRPGGGAVLHPVDIERVIRSALSVALSRIARSARVDIRLDDLPPVVGQENQLMQVFLNLFLNAADAMSRARIGSGHVLRVSAKVEDEAVEVVVRDTGVGIPEEDLERVFEPFFTTRGTEEGAGLGLSISRSIVEAMGGSVHASSPPAEGASFHVLLRRHGGHNAAPPDADPPVRGPELKVLVVEDDPAVAMAIARTLAQHEVDVAHSGEDALGFLRDGGDYAVILCDLTMPGIGGRGLYDALVKERPGVLDRIVFVSADADFADAREFLASVPNTLLRKPFEPSRLRALVRETADTRS